MGPGGFGAEGYGERSSINVTKHTITNKNICYLRLKFAHSSQSRLSEWIQYFTGFSSLSQYYQYPSHYCHIQECILLTVHYLETHCSFLFFLFLLFFTLLIGLFFILIFPEAEVDGCNSGQMYPLGEGVVKPSSYNMFMSFIIFPGCMHPGLQLTQQKGLTVWQTWRSPS